MELRELSELSEDYIAEMLTKLGLVWYIQNYYLTRPVLTENVSNILDYYTYTVNTVKTSATYGVQNAINNVQRVR